MKRHLILLSAGFMVFSVTDNARAAKPTPAPKPTPTPTPDPAKDPKIQKILADLKPAYPGFSAEDVLTTSAEDLRKMYVEAYCKQGMKLVEARQKAEGQDLALTTSGTSTPRPTPTPRSTPTPRPTPSGTPDPGADPVVQQVLSVLKEKYPQLTAADIVRTSKADLEQMAVDTYGAKGANLSAAHQKAAALLQDYHK